MEKNNTKAKLVLALFLMALVLSGVEGGRHVPENQIVDIPDNEKLWSWFGYRYPYFKWPHFIGWFGHYPIMAGLNKQNHILGSQTQDETTVAVSSSTVFP